MATQQNFRTAFNGFNREDVVHYIEYLNSKHAAEISQLNSELDLLRNKPDPNDNTSALEDQAARIDRLVARCTSLEKDLITLRLEKAQLENQLSYAPCADSEAEEKLAAALAEIEQLKTQITETAEANSEGDEKLTAVLAENLQLKSQIAADTKTCTDAEEKLAAALAENAQLKADLETARNQQAALESRKNEELEAYRRAERAERMAQERANQMYQKVNGVIADASCKVNDTADQLGQLSEIVMEQLEQLRQAVAGSNQALKDAADCMVTIRPEEE